MAALAALGVMVQQAALEQLCHSIAVALLIRLLRGPVVAAAAAVILALMGAVVAAVLAFLGRGPTEQEPVVAAVVLLLMATVVREELVGKGVVITNRLCRGVFMEAAAVAETQMFIAVAPLLADMVAQAQSA